MADSVASPLLRFLSDRIYTMFAGFPDTKILEKLQLTLAEIQTLVLEAEKRSEEDEALKRWITALKDAAYCADDLIDEYNLWMMNRKVRSFISLSPTASYLVFGFMLGRKLKRIEARLDVLLKRRVDYWRGLFPSYYTSKGLEETYSNPRVDSHSTCLLHESKIVGRAEDKLKILSMLFQEDLSLTLSTEGEDHRFSVIPIVGMGGLGKTTLAQLVYNDERVSCHFDLKAWVYVGENFEVDGIAKAIMERITTLDWSEQYSKLDNISILRNALVGKRFLIVLDDVWNEDYDKWWPLETLFNAAASGSKVIITSRNERAATILGSKVTPYLLEPLADEDSWFLLKRVAFGSLGEEDDPKLQEIGKRIVRQCKGLPLAIRTLGGLLRTKRGRTDWSFFMDEDMWNSPQFESHILPVLRLSYNHLPADLKQCFAICSIFPKGCTINKEKLIHLWIAEGFVQSSKGASKRLEEVGNDHFMELLQRSFFMDVSRGEFGEIVDCRMHDLVHDLALSVANIGCSIVKTEGPQQDVSKELRHSSLVGDSVASSTVPEALHEATNLRTLLLLSCKFESIPNIFLKFGRLRTLDLSRTGIRILSATIGTLKHLRYLDLSQNLIRTLPESISNLKNLQTLELVGCRELLTLPRAIGGLINLRNLDIEACSSLLYIPSGIGNLKLLQKLPLFILGENNDSICLGELCDLDLRGTLVVKRLEYVRDPVKARDARLDKKQGIQSLRLSWGRNVDLNSERSDEVLENLKPSPYLKVLEIAGYKGSAFPSWIRYLPNVAKVSLSNCSCRELPPLGELPHLRDLYIKGMSEVRFIGNEFYGNSNGSSFPSLKQLELDDLPNLWEWRDFELGKASVSTTLESSSDLHGKAFPCLDTVTVKGCRMLGSLPSFPRLTNLALWNSNEKLLCSLRHLTCISSLLVYEFRNVVNLPQDLGSEFIKNLTIYDCEDLIMVLGEGLGNFSNLEHLSILYCNKLKALPSGLRLLKSLRKLDIIECGDLVKFGTSLMGLSFLEELTFEGCPDLMTSPLGMDLPTNLRKLVIRRCPLLQGSLNKHGEGSYKIGDIPCLEIDSGRFPAEGDTPPSDFEY